VGIESLIILAGGRLELLFRLVDKRGTKEMCTVSLSSCSVTFRSSRLDIGNMMCSIRQGLLVIVLHYKNNFDTKNVCLVAC